MAPSVPDDEFHYKVKPAGLSIQEKSALKMCLFLF